MFIQIGDLYINQDHIVVIAVEPDSVTFLLDIEDGGRAMWERFEGPDREFILDWLEYKAEVSMVC